MFGFDFAAVLDDFMQARRYDVSLLVEAEKEIQKIRTFSLGFSALFADEVCQVMCLSLQQT